MIIPARRVRFASLADVARVEAQLAAVDTDDRSQCSEAYGETDTDPVCKCECGLILESNRKPVCEHKWDGPEITFDGGRGMSVTCSRCGYDAMSHTMRCF